MQCSLLHLLSFSVITVILTESVYFVCNDDTCDTCIKQSDFDSGTYRITEGNKKYCLSQDITFNPRPGDSINPNDPYKAWFPDDSEDYKGCQSLSGGAFALGYFAAITIEADNVELDLKNYKISMDKSFYIQQRAFTIIEVGTSPFITGQGPADFGMNEVVKNTYIHDGIIGLSSHSGLHSNDAVNITLENLRICDFETAGIQFNGFDGLMMNNLIIGPSSTQVKPCGYYSNAKYLSYALYKMIDDEGADSEQLSVTFNGGRTLTLKEIYDNLITSLDIAYRSYLGETTDADKNNPLYDISISLYTNPTELPDGAALYGINLHSYGPATGGFGAGLNEKGHGEKVRASNIKIQDLKLNNNEIPAAYFDKCEGNAIETVTEGPFGDIMDIRRMVGDWYNAQVIDLGDDYTGLTYIGNPLSDAQIALGLFGDKYNTLYGTKGQNEAFLRWALDEYNGVGYEGLPECTCFVCNGDIMYHTNKGIIGFRLDYIEDVVLENIVIKRLINKSPLSSYACSNYSGPHDGGNPQNEKEEGGMGTDTKGIAISGGDVIFDGFNNVIEKLISYNGDVVGLDIKRDTKVIFDYVYKDEMPKKDDDIDTEDDRSAIHIKQLCPGHEITFGLLAELMNDQKYPYPNNFFACNILLENKELNGSITPYPPNGVDKVWCADYIPDDKNDIIAHVLPVDVKIDAKNENNNDNINTYNNPNDNEGTTSPIISAHSAVGNSEDKIVHLMNDNKKHNIGDNNKHFIDVINKYPNTPYIYFIIGLICIIMVVFVLVTFIMKCGKMMMSITNDNNIRKNKKTYQQTKYIDSDDSSSSDLTEDEDIFNNQI